MVKALIMQEFQLASFAALRDAAPPDVPGRFIRAFFVASTLRKDGHITNYTRAKWQKAKAHLLLALEMRLMEDSAVQSLKLCTERDVAGVPQDLIVSSTLHLKSTDQVLGFKAYEVKSQETGGSLYYSLRVLLQTDGGLRAEPVSRELISSSFGFPGNEITLQSRCKPPLEVVGFRVFCGCFRHHVTGLIYSSDRSLERATPEYEGNCMMGLVNGAKRSFERVTGQVGLFWVDLWALTCGLYYFDVLTDVQQLFLFIAQGQYAYLVLNCFGMAIPIVATILDAVNWTEAKVLRPQSDMFHRMVPSAKARIALIIACVASQGHMLILVIASTSMRARHDLLLGARHAEVAEAAISASVQSNYWLMIVLGLESVPDSSFQSLTVSLLMSCISLAFGFASRDKLDARVLHVPGKLDWGLHFALLFFFRALEVSSRLLAINMIHLAVRAVPISGPLVVALLVATAYLLFPEKQLSQILAAAIAHPGQVLLGSRSRFPLRVSLKMHFAVQLVALGLQGLLYVTSWLPEGKIAPWPLLVASVSSSLVGNVGLCMLARLGNSMPLLANHQLLDCTALAAVVDLPEPSVSVLAAVDEITIDLKDLSGDSGDKPWPILQKLADARTAVCIPALTMEKLLTHGRQVEEQLFRMDVIQADFPHRGPENLLHIWRWDRCCWRLQAVRFSGNVPAGVMEMVARCEQLEEVQMPGVLNRGDGWEKLRTARWPKLKVANFASSFDDDWSEPHAAAVLAALANCEKLEVINFKSNRDPTTEGWEALLADPKTWPVLQWDRCDFGKNPPSEEFRNLRPTAEAEAVDVAKADFCLCVKSLMRKDADPASLGPEMLPERLMHLSLGGNNRDKSFDVAGLLPLLAVQQDVEVLDASCHNDVPSEAWRSLADSSWPQLKSAGFEGTFSQESPAQKGSTAVFRMLARARRLERIDLSGCEGIPAKAWELLRGGDWPELREADFNFCFSGRALGCSKAGVLMELLARCSRLQRISFSGCQGISANDFEMLGRASWPELTHADFRSCEFGWALPALLQMLSRCPKLERLEMSDSSARKKDLLELRAGCWPKLKYCDVLGCGGLQPLTKPYPQWIDVRKRFRRNTKQSGQKSHHAAIQVAEDETARVSTDPCEIEQPREAADAPEPQIARAKTQKKKKKYRLVPRTKASARRESSLT